ncbi:MAG: aspartate aminotransferase family protein [Chloroflexi bacterium]|nr:aspartate aminotransferase family protein [Chloroflexota bacterium]
MPAPSNGKLLPRDVTRLYPRIVRGEGCAIYDETGKRYLDAIAGIAVVNIGHGRAQVAEALAAQAQTLSYVQSSIFENRPALELAERVGRVAPAGLNSAFFVSGGSEATETAIKLARQYHVERGDPSRYIMISRWQSYHGGTLGALSLSGIIGRREKFAPLLLDFPHIPECNCYRCPFNLTHPSCGIRCAHELETAIKRAGARNVAAFIAEPIVGAAAGATTPPAEYFGIIREICDRYGILFIADEVITGFGRTGRNFGIEHWGVTPDIITSAKGLSGGYAPLGAVLAHDRVRDAFAQAGAAFVHGYTMSSNPLAAAVGVAVLDIIEGERLVERVAALEAGFFARGRSLLKHRTVGEVRGKGLLMGIELVRDQHTKEPFPPGQRANAQLAAIALRCGLVIYPGGGTADGVNGDHFLLCPPFTISTVELDELFGKLDESLTEFEQSL